jgi:hypothetical protein
MDYLKMAISRKPASLKMANFSSYDLIDIYQNLQWQSSWVKLFWYFWFSKQSRKVFLGHFNEIFEILVTAFQNDQYKSHFERTAIDSGARKHKDTDNFLVT